MRARALVASLAAVVLSLGGCERAREVQVFPVSVVNDAASEVVVRDCADFCSSSPFSLNLKPRASAPVNRTTNEHKYLSVETASGAHVGCIDLFFRTAQPGAAVPVSAAIPCPRNGRPWKEIALVALVLLGGLALGGRHARGS